MSNPSGTDENNQPGSGTGADDGSSPETEVIDPAALAHAADAIGETDEYQRCLDLLDDCDRSARGELGLA